jgi:hypothetical protein
VRALLCPLFARSAWDQPETMVEGTTRDGVALASVRLDSMGTDNYSEGGQDSQGAALASVPSVGVGSARDCGGGRFG